MDLLLKCSKEIFEDVPKLFILGTLGVCIGFVINQFHDDPLPLIYSSKANRVSQAVAAVSQMDQRGDLNSKGHSSDASSEVVGIESVDLSKFREMVDNKDLAIILDARPEIFHRLGHVPGAVSLPREDFEASYKKIRALLERDKGRTIAVYCSNSGCEDSQMVAEALSKLSYTRILVFKGGWSDWTNAHLPEEK